MNHHHYHHICHFRCTIPTKDTAVLEQARLETFWEHHRFRTNKKGDWKDVEHFSPMFQFIGHADFLVTTPIPLQRVVPFDSTDVYSEDFPQFDYYPETHGWQEKERHLVSTLGYWPESGQFPLLIAEDMAKVCCCCCHCYCCVT